MGTGYRFLCLKGLHTVLVNERNVSILLIECQAFVFCEAIGKQISVCLPDCQFVAQHLLWEFIHFANRLKVGFIIALVFGADCCQNSLKGLSFGAIDPRVP